MQLLSRVQLFASPCTPGFPVLHYLLEFVQTHVRWVDDAIQLSHPLSPPSPPVLNLWWHQSLFQWVGSYNIRWSKYWSFSFSPSPSNKYLGWISFRMDCFDLAVQGTLKSLLQHHSLKASVLWCSAFFMVQLSHPYITTGKTIVESAKRWYSCTSTSKVGKFWLSHALARIWCRPLSSLYSF